MQGRSSSESNISYLSKTEPSKYIIERLLDGSLLTQEGEDADLLELQNNAELRENFKKDILPLLNELELHLLTQKMIALEFRSQHGNSALRNNTLPRFLARYELNKYMTSSAREQLSVLKKINEKIAEQKMIMAVIQGQSIVEEQHLNLELNAELRKEIRRLLSMLFPLPNAVLQILYLVQQHVAEGDRTPKNFVNFVMFNLYGVHMPGICSETFYADIYAVFVPEHSSNAKLTIRTKGEKQSDEHVEERQKILAACKGQRELESKAPGISDDDAASIMAIYLSYKRFTLRRKNSESIGMLTAQTPEIRYKQVQQYMQAQATLIAKGEGKKHLYQAVMQFYKKQNIDPVKFFDIDVQSVVIKSSATTLRRSMGIGL